MGSRGAVGTLQVLWLNSQACREVDSVFHILLFKWENSHTKHGKDNFCCDIKLM